MIAFVYIASLLTPSVVPLWCTKVRPVSKLVHMPLLFMDCVASFVVYIAHGFI
jgi:hypothetical protein